MSLLLEPLQYAFFQRGLMIGMLLGLACGALGCFVVLRGMAFIGDAMAHAILPGVVIAYLAGVDIVAGAFGAGVLAAVLISGISRTEQVKEDTAIGIVFTGAFALGIVLISRVQGYMRDLSHFLFGNILGTAPSDMIFTAIVAALVLLCLVLWYRDLLVSSFDATQAQAIGLQVGLLHLGLMMLLTLTVVAGIQAVGVVLIAALLITPAATARLLTDRLPVMIGLAMLLGSGAAVIGLYASYAISIASGGSIVLTSTLLFVLTLVFAPERGILARRGNARRGRMTSVSERPANVEGEQAH
jgi:ABC-type Mn2+/Zn2+ transport system permease subunit